MKVGGIEVKVGQIWQDWDIRSRNPRTARQVKVVEIDPAYWASDKGYAFVVTSHDGGRRWGTQRRRILLRRFRPTSTGYKLVKDFDPETFLATKGRQSQ